MSLGKTWYTVEDATKKFGIAKEQLLVWIAEGILRTDKGSGQHLLINGDDLDLKVQEISEI